MDETPSFIVLPVYIPIKREDHDSSVNLSQQAIGLYNHCWLLCSATECSQEIIIIIQTLEPQQAMVPIPSSPPAICLGTPYPFLISDYQLITHRVAAIPLLPNPIPHPPPPTSPPQPLSSIARPPLAPQSPILTPPPPCNLSMPPQAELSNPPIPVPTAPSDLTNTSMPLSALMSTNQTPRQVHPTTAHSSRLANGHGRNSRKSAPTSSKPE